MSRLYRIAPAHVADIWPQVKTFFESAYAETDLAMPDVLGWLEREAGHLWVVVDGSRAVAALTTSFEDRPSGKSLRLVSNGGVGLDGWVAYLAEIEAFARENQCVKVVMDGRRGWERVFRDYSPKRVTLEKVL